MVYTTIVPKMKPYFEFVVLMKQVHRIFGFPMNQSERTKQTYFMQFHPITDGGGNSIHAVRSNLVTKVKIKLDDNFDDLHFGHNLSSKSVYQDIEIRNDEIIISGAG